MPVVPACFNYNDVYTADLEKYHTIVAGRKSVLGASFYKTLQAEGKRIAQYINIVDVNPTFTLTGAFDLRFAKGAPQLGSLSNWRSFFIMDPRVQSWADNLVEQFKWAISVPELDDVFLDVFGNRLWSGAWASMPQTEWAARMTELGNRFGAVRDQYRPGARLYANGTWNGVGHPALVPVIEHHDSEVGGGFWSEYINNLTWDKAGQSAAFVIASTITAAQTWAKIPGVGPVAAQGTYGTAPASALPYATLTPRVTSTPPDPAPPPSTDPRDAQIATLTAERDAARAIALELKNRIDAAKTALG